MFGSTKYSARSVLSHCLVDHGLGCMQVHAQAAASNCAPRQQHTLQQAYQPLDQNEAAQQTNDLPDAPRLDNQAVGLQVQHAQVAELASLARAVREAEQRASGAELATMTVQRAHTEAVELSTRLQASFCSKILLCLVCRESATHVSACSRMTMQVAMQMRDECL